MQGSGLALVIWLMLTILLIRALYYTKIVPSHLTLITLKSYSTAALLYIDDVELIIKNADNEEVYNIV